MEGTMMKLSLMTRISIDMTREALLEAYCEFRAPNADWTGAIYEKQGNLIVAISTKSKQDLVFTPHDVVVWATAKFQEQALMVMF